MVGEVRAAVDARVGAVAVWQVSLESLHHVGRAGAGRERRERREPVDRVSRGHFVVLRVSRDSSVSSNCSARLNFAAQLQRR